MTLSLADPADRVSTMVEAEVPEPTFLERLRASLVDSDGLDTIPEPVPLVDGVLYRNSLAWLQGKPGAGKSLVALDIAGCVGTGQPWQLHPVTQGSVMYLAAEGAEGTRWRVRAWEQAMGTRMSGVQWLPMVVQAAVVGEWSALLTLAAEIRPVLFVADTQARVTVGMEENAAKDMGLFVDRLERLRRVTGACVLVLHHQGRNGEHMRGSTALDGAATTVLQVVKDEADLTVKCAKQKDAPEFGDIALRMVETANSVVLMPDDAAGTRRGGHLAAALKMAAKWWELFEGDSVSASKLIDSEVSTKSTFYRNVRALVDAGRAAKDSSGPHPRYRLTQPPMEG